MSPIRRVAMLLGGLVLMCGGGLALVAQSLPGNQGARLELGDVVGVETGGSYAWLVPTPHGVLLVDTGMDPAATAILDELARRGQGPDDVHTVLLTHGHVDHVSGGPRFPRARVLVGEADARMATGEEASTSLASRIFGLFLQRGVGKAPEPVDDGHVETIDGVVVRAIAVPGHTRGSVAWVVGDVLFSGDACMNAGPDGVAPSPWFVDESFDLATASIARLAGAGLDRMADGHVGVTEGAADAIEAFVAARR
jgi:glyoxylase-like metal-dependent hydrolase (beta-lactamase superfamily II)